MNIMMSRELLSMDVRDCLLGTALWCSIEWAIVSDVCALFV